MELRHDGNAEVSSRSAAGPKSNEGKNSAALDQWRGAALLFVLVSHGFFFTHRVDGVGRIGVNLFFFISGILVFRSLAGSRSGGAKLAWAFWKRRFIRLYPALVSYALVVGIFVWLLQNRPGLRPGSDFPTYLRALPIALVFGTNYDEATPLSIGHLWSVSVEMQFYLLAPLIYLAGLFRPAFRLVIWGGLLVVLMGSGMLEVARGYSEKYQFQVAAWPMMLGFLCESQKGWVARIPRMLITASIWLGGFTTILSIVIAAFGMKKVYVVGLGATVFVPCLLSYADHRLIPGWIGRFFKWVGERTYSVYLWQQPLTICDYLPNVLHPVGALLAIPIGAGWYRYFERPFLSGGRRRATEHENLLAIAPRGAQ
jgi:peptidoglycan/LPS O-acetylase OafA/YrhL